MAKTQTFSLYLAKQSVSQFEELLTQSARDMVKAKTAKQSNSSTFGEGATLYTFPGIPLPPKWVPLLSPHFNLPDLRYMTPCAVLAFKQSKSIFAVTFSFGHAYVDDKKTEADFGLRVAINAVSDKRLRSVERSNIGAAIRGFAQAAQLSELRAFGFDDALDLIRKVSGYTGDDTDIADMLTGSRSLRFSKKMDVTEIPDTAAEAATLYKSTAYKKTAFRVLDFLAPVLDSDEIEKLDNELIDRVRGTTDEFEISIPDFIEDSVCSFRFEHAHMSDFHPDLSLDLYRNGLGAELSKLPLEDLKKHTVAAYKQDSGNSYEYWYLYDALVGSIVLNQERYALNEGRWYKIGKTYKDAADSKFKLLAMKPDTEFRPLKTQVQTVAKKGQKIKKGYQSEESYNEEIAAENGLLLLDQRLIQIDEVPGPGIEACDLLDVKGRRFIHIKKSSRQSSVLSHFFKQGGNAAQMLKKYEPFKGGVVSTIGKYYGSKTAKEIEAAFGKKDPWAVEYRIADSPRHNGKMDIPFFSKLSLHDEARNLEAMGYDVRVGFIKLNPVK